MYKIKHCAETTINESSNMINYLDTKCFNFVKTLYNCNFNVYCIWDLYHKIKEIPVLCDEFSTFELKME